MTIHWPDERSWTRIFIGTLILASVSMLVLLVAVGRWLTFWYDEWDFILLDPLTAASFFQPHVDHLSVVSVAIYQMLLRTFGLGSYWPFLLVTWALHFVTVSVLFRIASRLAGSFVGFLAALSLLFLGSAYEDLLQAFQLSFLTSTAAGLIALDLLTGSKGQQQSSRRLALVSGALLVAVGSSSVGVLFLGLAIAYLVLSRDGRGLLGTVVPVLLYAVWYVTWGQADRGLPSLAEIDLGSLVLTVGYGLGAAVSGVVGLPPEQFAPFGWGVGALVAIAAILRRAKLGRLGVAALLTLLAEYSLQALFRADYGLEHAARSGYIYPAAIFLWLVVADVLSETVGHVSIQGRRWRSLMPAAIAVALVLAMALGNMRQFVGAARAMRDLRATEVTELQLLETIRNVAGLALDVSPDPALMPQLTGRRYLAAVDRYGSPVDGFRLDPKAAVDQEAVSAAAMRMLGPAVTVATVSAVGSTPPQVAAHGALVGQSRDGCVQVVPKGVPFQVEMTGVRGGFSLGGSGAAEIEMQLALSGLPPTAPPDEVRTAARAGSAIVLPRLPAQLSWDAVLVGASREPFIICSQPSP